MPTRSRLEMTALGVNECRHEATIAEKPASHL